MSLNVGVKVRMADGRRGVVVAPPLSLVEVPLQVLNARKARVDLIWVLPDEDKTKKPVESFYVQAAISSLVVV